MATTDRPRRLNRPGRKDEPIEEDALAASAVATLEPEVDALPAKTDERPRTRRFSLRTFDSLQVPAFRFFFFSMFGWFASMNMQMLVRGVIVFDLTGSYAALGIVSLANAIPGMILSLPGGVMADRVTKKHVIQVGQTGNMIVSGVLAGLMLSDMLVFEHLVACAVIQGTINALIMPARQSMIPEIVGEDRIMNAVSLNTAAMNVMRLIAPMFGGVLLAAFGPGWVYLTIAGLYGASAIFLTPVRSLPKTAAVLERDERRRLNHSGSYRDLIEGFKYMRRDRIVTMVLLVNLMIVLFSMPYQMMLPGFVKEVLDGGEVRLALLMTLTGVGSLAGSLVIASLPARNRGMILLVSSLVLGISLCAFAASSIYWVSAVIVLVGIGIGQAGRMSLATVLLQSYTEPEYRGRVMSVNMLEFSLTSFAVFFVGILANIFGVQIAIGVTGACLVVFVLATLLFMPRMRHLD